MKSKLIIGLVVLNMALVGLFASLIYTPQKAEAQGFGNNTNYIMMPGRLMGQASQVIYIFDMNRGIVITVSFVNGRELKAIAVQNFAEDFKRAGQNR